MLGFLQSSMVSDLQEVLSNSMCKLWKNLPIQKYNSWGPHSFSYENCNSLQISVLRFKRRSIFHLKSRKWAHKSIYAIWLHWGMCNHNPHCPKYDTYIWIKKLNLKLTYWWYKMQQTERSIWNKHGTPTNNTTKFQKYFTCMLICVGVNYVSCHWCRLWAHLP